jgi:uncharacterized membrane protein
MKRPVRLNIIFNAVLVVATSVMIAPSYAESAHYSLVGGFFGGLVVSLLLRTPGVYFERLLARRGRYRRIYITHAITGILTALVVLTNHYTTGADAVGSAVGVYLFSSSICLGIVTFVTYIISLMRKRHRSVEPSQPVKTYDQPPRSVGSPAQERSNQNDEQVSIKTPTDPASGVSDALSKNSHDIPQSEEKSTIAQANRAGLVLGIVTGIASLVQGYDSHDVYRTVTALAAGGVGVAVMYLLVLGRRH